MTLYVFNPEHDICSANGDRNFVPPQSALDFARDGKGIMRLLYGSDAEVTNADGYAQWCADHAEPDRIVPWGWDLRLKQTLLKQGVNPSLLPEDEWIRQLRRLQHRTTVLPLQTNAWSTASIDEIMALVEQYRSVVLKAPWSGAGRGLRWVDGAMSSTDVSWAAKTIATQNCVVVEKRYKVAFDFALEIESKNHCAVSSGLSFFVTQSGVYRHNILLSDDVIRSRVGLTAAMESRLLEWVQANVSPFYEGPLGIDMVVAEDGEIHVTEMNLRHTMGQVAHEFLRQHPERVNTIFKPTINDVC